MSIPANMSSLNPPTVARIALVRLWPWNTRALKMATREASIITGTVGLRSIEPASTMSNGSRSSTFHWNALPRKSLMSAAASRSPPVLAALRPTVRNTTNDTKKAGPVVHSMLAMWV